MQIENLNCFKAYDVRGKIGDEINEDIAYRIGRSVAQSLDAKIVALGFDARETSPSLAKATAKGVCQAGADVLQLGLVGTEEIYSAVSEFNAGAGIEITASHNPIDYNGMKIVKHSSMPLLQNDLAKIKNLVKDGKFFTNGHIGSVIDVKIKAREAYIAKILRFIDLKALRPLKIAINSGNGAAGPAIDSLKKALEKRGVKTNFVYLNHNPDSSFPNGIPNPLLEENRSSTANAVVSEKADFGVAFDGDFDRCFFFDHFGKFIPGEYVVGLLAEVFLNREKEATIIHDPRVIWNTLDVINACGGHAVTSKTGHAFVKDTMRQNRAIYGGEMSAHHYFRDFAYCDSGMIPWLLIWELLCKKNISLAELISKRKRYFPSSGEINFTVSNSLNCILKIKNLYSSKAETFNELDGLSMSFKNWRFNLRISNTEPLVRLNVETKSDQLLLREKTEELRKIISNS